MRIIIFITLILLACLPLQAQDVSGKLILRKKIFYKYNSSFEVDYRKNKNNLYHRHYDFSIKIPLKYDLKLSINYRSIHKFRSNNKKWEAEKRPHIALEKSFDTIYTKLWFRTRQEYRYKYDNTEQARNRIRVKIRSTQNICKIKPFISNEFFYDLDENKYDKNWLAIGADYSKTKFAKYSMYYKYVNKLQKEKNWTGDYAIVLKAIYQF